MQTKEIEINVHDLIKYLKDRWINIALVVLIASIISFGVSALFITPVYESQSMIYITTNGQEGTVVQNMLSSLQAGNALTADYKTLATSKPVLDQVIKNLKLDMTYTELRENISTENPENTRILTLKVKDTDPEQAKNIVNELTKIERDKIADIMGMMEPSVMQWGETSTSPVSSSPIRNAVLCGLIALVLASGFYITRFIKNDNIIDPEDIEKTLDVRNLAEVPVIPELATKADVKKTDIKDTLKKIFHKFKRSKTRSERRREARGKRRR